MFPLGDVPANKYQTLPKEILPTNGLIDGMIDSLYFMHHFW